ncbi:tyrosine-protein phosphatase non-receptor type 14 [Terrapene carolina triunguis]|uniref:tyrosine-protein phosphatase non-receptor type 14 n=1 Tax=Terrapene triunguis TaxID=2587831 RepID=UPI0011563BE8|nr:tyrosine-protein phosphatase non-receptor type 14 [Terrapene carolina triunguis]
MPFGLKLRRTRRYNVLSKNCFVTQIRLLDNNVIECTLSVESTGQECLEAVAQRLELRETHYFGLWFLSKSQQARWVELEKPLKKQLDKFANEPLLFFGVMFYVPNVSRLQQEVTRYQYYLQVKKDVLDGRLRSSLDQGIRLAGLAVQADFGDYNQFESHDFLREYVLFPMDWTQDEAVLEDLTQKVAQEHKTHSGIPAAEAELMYISEVERLEGFGQESFPVKDNHGNDMHLGIFFMGIFIKNRIGRPTVIYRWNDIGNIIHNKSSIIVELINKEETVLFHTDDIENAKYISRLFAARHKFYKQNKICTDLVQESHDISTSFTTGTENYPLTIHEFGAVADPNLEKQKMAGLEAQKRPLMLAALNGLSVARVPVPEDSQDEVAKVPMDERCKILKRKLEEGMVFTEYEQIPKKKADGIFTTAALPENAERNRIREVVPYEENRVELVPTKENNTGYINASHIKVTVGGEEWHYIATQGPLPHTCHDFWQMVWEQGVNVIAMVTAEEEGGRSKSHRYWPKLGSKHSSATYGKFKVTTKFRTDSGCYATTGLKVKHLLSGQERTVWHLQYTDWPDHGCPEEVQGFLSYLEEIQSVRRHTNSVLDASNNCNPPIVVHCSAGVGRTGVVILTELMIGCLEHNEKVDVPVMLRHLREQRMFMIQTIAQYKFVYRVLIQFLQNSRLI